MFADRQRQGFNAAIVSLIGATANGAPSDDGATFDGLLPFGTATSCGGRSRTGSG